MAVFAVCWQPCCYQKTGPDTSSHSESVASCREWLQNGWQSSCTYFSMARHQIHHKLYLHIPRNPRSFCSRPTAMLTYPRAQSLPLVLTKHDNCWILNINPHQSSSWTLLIIDLGDQGWLKLPDGDGRSPSNKPINHSWHCEPLSTIIQPQLSTIINHHPSLTLNHSFNHYQQSQINP